VQRRGAGRTFRLGLGFRAARWILFGSFVLASVILLPAPTQHTRDLPTRPVGPSESAGTIGA
jgi:hypothetical protein